MRVAWRRAGWKEVRFPPSLLMAQTRREGEREEPRVIGNLVLAKQVEEWSDPPQRLGSPGQNGPDQDGRTPGPWDREARKPVGLLSLVVRTAGGWRWEFGCCKWSKVPGPLDCKRSP